MLGTEARYEINTDLDPGRTAAWRWERARRLCSQGRRCGRAEHPAVRQAVRYIRLWNDAKDAKEQDAANRRVPLVFAASALYAASPIARARTEALLLAGETDAQIAEKTGTLPQVVDTYEPLFFAVRGTLNEGDWLTRHVLAAGGPELDEFEVWRWLGLAGGSPLVDLAVEDFLDPFRVGDAGRHTLTNAARRVVRRHVRDWAGRPSAEVVLKGVEAFKDLWPHVLRNPDGRALAGQLARARLDGLSPLVPA